MRFLFVLSLVAQAAVAQSLTTTFASNAAQSGNMFDLTGVQPVIITGVDINLTPGTWNLEVYTVTSGGTWVGKQADPSAWTLVGSVANVVSNGADVATPLPLPLNVPLAAGQTLGFYITTTATGSLRYTVGTAVGNVYTADASLQIREGAGVAYPFGVAFQPRVWNGTVRYEPTTPATLTTTFAANNSQSGTMFDVVGLRQVAVSGFDVHLYAGTWNLEVYRLTQEGSFVGHETDPAAWTRIGGVAGVVSNGPGVATPLPIAINTLISAGERRAFYVTCTNGTATRYTDGTGVGNVAAADGNIQVLEGIGISYPFGGTFSPRIWNGTVRYARVATHYAINAALGPACGYDFTSFYETFDAARAFDLQGTALKWTYLGNRYAVDNVAPIFMPPTPAATIVAGGVLDGQQTFALAAPMPVPGGTTSALTVCTKGYIGAGATNPVNFSPTGGQLLAFPETTWACWHDYNQVPAGSGKITFEQIGGIAYATWNGVYTYGTNQPKTLQFQFHLATGNVTLVMGSFVGGASVLPIVVGFSPGGPSLDPSVWDLSAKVAGTGLFYTALSDEGLVLNPGNWATTGGTWLLNLSNIPATGVIGVEVLGFADPGITDLAVIGMPTCSLRSSLDVMTPWLVSGPSHTYGVTVPNNLQLFGAEVFTTTAVFQVPPVNAFGAVTSRGIRATIGNW